MTKAKNALRAIIAETKKTRNRESFVNFCDDVSCSVCPIAQGVEGTDENCNGLHNSKEWKNIYASWIVWLVMECKEVIRK